MAAAISLELTKVSPLLFESHSRMLLLLTTSHVSSLILESPYAEELSYDR